MDDLEILRYMAIIKKHVDGKKLKAARTAEQIADIQQRGVESMWRYLGGVMPELTVFPGAGENHSEHVVVCIPFDIDKGLVAADNRIAQCAWGCGTPMQHRPYLPSHITKVCIKCMAERLERGDQ